ncbi:MAG: amidohydrolase family protein [Gammaproteobacteria bacterium]|nr:amidohydrolase family protein [Gammaproteobacteria bacterium]
MFLAAAAFAAGCAPSSEPAADAAAPPPDAPADTVVIEGARVFDGHGELGSVSLVVEDGRIARIIPAGEDDGLPAAAERIDYGGRYIIPGLVSAHSHVGNTDGTEHGDRFYTRDHVVRNLRQFQAYGVTTVTSLGLNGEGFFDIREEVNADPGLGAQLYGAGAGIGVMDGAPPAAGMGLENDPVARPASADEARQAIRDQVDGGVDLVKLWVDDLGGSAPQMAPEVYAAAIEEAHRYGVKVAAHIHDMEPAAGLVAAGVDIIAHGVRDRPMDPGLVEAMASAGTWYVPTVFINEANYWFAENPERLDDPFVANALQSALREQFVDGSWRESVLSGDAIGREKAAVDTTLANLRAAREGGVAIGFGTDSGAMPQRLIGFAEHRELELMTEAGFTPEQALAVATRDSARLLGLDDRGTLAVGRRADFIVLEANPLQDIRNTRGIVAVWQAGRQVSGLISEYAPR